MPIAPGFSARAFCAFVVLAATACASGGSRPVETVPVPDAAPAAARPESQPSVPLESPPPPDPSAAMDLASEENPLVLFEVEGEATYYADKFDGRRTASGIISRWRKMVPLAVRRPSNLSA